MYNTLAIALANWKVKSFDDLLLKSSIDLFLLNSLIHTYRII